MLYKLLILQKGKLMRIMNASSEPASTPEPETPAPSLSVVSVGTSESRGPQKPAREKDWDPYVVWKKLIRRNSDPA